MRSPLAPCLLLVACGGQPTWHQDVAPIVEARCGSCHTEGAVAPFALDTYEQAAGMGPIVAAAAESGLMPPWFAEDVRAYSNDHSLTDEQIATVVDWVAADMPEGDPDDPGEALPATATSLPRTDLTLSMPEAYEPVGDPDDYRCFVLDWPEATDLFVTGFEPHPGNDALVHHIAAFLVRPDNLAGQGAFDQIRGWDAGSAGPGYACFGGPGSSETEEDLRAPIQQLAQWVPGGGAFVFPEGSGIEVPAGSMIVLQLHYFDQTDGTDLTTIDFMTEESVARKGAFAPWLDATWPLGNMEIPPGGTDIDKVDDPRDFWQLMTGGLDLEAGFDIHSTMMHMHTRGVGGSTWIEHADGTREDILVLEKYDFDWQFNYQLAEPARFAPGDQLGVECVFANDGDAPINWGEGTLDEMCVSNLFVTEL
ncbi:MAG: hypothetical protein EP330_07895 [Deltaproteobacteria bacterium]|nr:MAG: hypothetical protein EP330_07895 [Deltaproteobacteria bacterium]